MIIEREKGGGGGRIIGEIGGDESSEVLIQKVWVLPYNSVSRTRIYRCILYKYGSIDAFKKGSRDFVRSIDGII